MATFLEELQRLVSKPTVKRHLSVVRMLVDWLVLGQALPWNPASVVRGPKYFVKNGKRLFSRAKNSEARRFYQRAAIQGGWSVRQLDRQIATLANQRTRGTRALDRILPFPAHVSG